MQSDTSLIMRNVVRQMEQRRYQRYKVEVPIWAWSIASDSNRAVHGHSVNLSQGGVGAIIGGPWQPGQVVTMQIMTPQDPQPILVEARLSHRNQLYCGFEFLGANEQVMTQLKNACAEA